MKKPLDYYIFWVQPWTDNGWRAFAGKHDEDGEGTDADVHADGATPQSALACVIPLALDHDDGLCAHGKHLYYCPDCNPESPPE